MENVFVLRRYLKNCDEYSNDNEIMLLAHETAVAALTSTVVTLRIREALGQGRSAGANFNFHMVEIHSIRTSMVTNRHFHDINSLITLMDPDAINSPVLLNAIRTPHQTLEYFGRSKFYHRQSC